MHKNPEDPSYIIKFTDKLGMSRDIEDVSHLSDEARISQVMHYRAGMIINGLTGSIKIIRRGGEVDITKELGL